MLAAFVRGASVSLSTRLSILNHALGDVMERLGELPVTAETDALRARARLAEKQIEHWKMKPPSDEARAALLRSVIDLNVEVMRVGKPAPTASGPDSR
jgi:hypothetical protein